VNDGIIFPSNLKIIEFIRNDSDTDLPDDVDGLFPDMKKLIPNVETIVLSMDVYNLWYKRLNVDEWPPKLSELVIETDLRRMPYIFETQRVIEGKLISEAFYGKLPSTLQILSLSVVKLRGQLKLDEGLLSLKEIFIHTLYKKLGVDSMHDFSKIPQHLETLSYYTYSDQDDDLARYINFPIGLVTFKTNHLILEKETPLPPGLQHLVVKPLKLRLSRKYYPDCTCLIAFTRDLPKSLITFKCLINYNLNDNVPNDWTDWPTTLKYLQINSTNGYTSAESSDEHNYEIGNFPDGLVYLSLFYGMQLKPNTTYPETLEYLKDPKRVFTTVNPGKRYVFPRNLKVLITENFNPNVRAWDHSFGNGLLSLTLTRVSLSSISILGNFPNTLRVLRFVDIKDFIGQHPSEDIGSPATPHN